MLTTALAQVAAPTVTLTSSGPTSPKCSPVIVMTPPAAGRPVTELTTGAENEKAVPDALTRPSTVTWTSLFSPTLLGVTHSKEV